MRNLAIIKNNHGSIMTLGMVGEKVQITHGLESFEITVDELVEITSKIDQKLPAFHQLNSNNLIEIIE